MEITEYSSGERAKSKQQPANNQSDLTEKWETNTGLW